MIWKVFFWQPWKAFVAAALLSIGAASIPKKARASHLWPLSRAFEDLEL